MGRKIHPDRVPEDDLDFFDVDGFFEYDEEPQERKPRKREPEKPRCRNCLDRYLIEDGYGEFVHEDNGLYSCETDPRQRKHSTQFARPVLR